MKALVKAFSSFFFFLAIFCASLLTAESSKLRPDVDLIVFSYNRPMQLFAFLESAEKHMRGLNQLHVIYRSTDEQFEEGYKVVALRFPKVHYHRQSANASADFQPLVIQSVFSQATKARYVVFAVDDIIVTDKVDLHVCTRAIEKTHSWAFYLRLGKNIRECYAMNIATPPPKGKKIGKALFQWRFSDGKGDWSYPNSVDMTIFRKSRIEQFLRHESYTHPPSMEGRWADLGAKSLHRKGISFRYSKMINIPLNSVGPYNNRHMHSFTPAELQEKFKQGLKIDISRFYRMRNKAPHVDCELTFIKR